MPIRSRIRRGMRRALVALLVIASTACLALAAGTLLRSAAVVLRDGAPVTIYVVSNGFHSDIVVPADHDLKDWRPLMRLSPITRQSLDAPFLAFGWGSQAAYTQLGTLSDLSAGVVLKAIAFDASVVHLQPVAAMTEGKRVRRLAVTPDGYRRLVRHIEDSLARTIDGDAILLDNATHGTGDAFLRGRDRFWLLRSCNVWVGEALRSAGQPTGLWTPLAQSLMWSLDAAAGQQP